MYRFVCDVTTGPDEAGRRSTAAETGGIASRDERTRGAEAPVFGPSGTRVRVLRGENRPPVESVSGRCEKKEEGPLDPFVVFVGEPGQSGWSQRDVESRQADLLDRLW